MRRGIFIQRDGILNELRMEAKNPISPLTLDEFKVKSDAEAALRELKAAGFVLIITTHQPGLSRGDQSRWELDRMHDLLRRRFPIDDLLICPHEEADFCSCRAPRPGLLMEAAFNWQLNLEYSFVISDKWQDAEAGRFAGCTSLLVQSPWVGKAHPDFVLPDLDGIVQKILSLRRPAGLVSSPRPLTPPILNGARRPRGSESIGDKECGKPKRSGAFASCKEPPVVNGIMHEQRMCFERFATRQKP